MIIDMILLWLRTVHILYIVRKMQIGKNGQVSLDKTIFSRCPAKLQGKVSLWCMGVILKSQIHSCILVCFFAVFFIVTISFTTYFRTLIHTCLHIQIRINFSTFAGLSPIHKHHHCLIRNIQTRIILSTFSELAPIHIYHYCPRRTLMGCQLPRRKIFQH